MNDFTKEELKKAHDDNGCCGSCGWHAGFYEMDYEPTGEIIDGSKEWWDSCKKHEDEDDYGPDGDWEEPVENSRNAKTNSREQNLSRDNAVLFKNTKTSFYPNGGGLGNDGAKRDQSAGNIGAQRNLLPAATRNSSQSLLAKYGAPNNGGTDLYESKNPNIINQYVKSYDHTPTYSKKQPGLVRLDPLNAGYSSTTMNNKVSQEFISQTLDANMPKKGKTQLKPLNNLNSNNNGQMKLQFQATVYIDQNGVGKNY